MGRYAYEALTTKINNEVHGERCGALLEEKEAPSSAAIKVDRVRKTRQAEQ